MLKFLANLPRDFIYSVPRYQLAKSSTSIGSNYEEASRYIGAESKDDFIHKIGIVLKESRESHYWLRVLKAVYREQDRGEMLNNFITQATEFKKIFTSIRLTAQKGKKS